jgi:F-type H+-transporting ATPase subunit epsilon
MKLMVLSPKQTIFEGEVRSIFLPGDLAEFELLDYHAPIVSLLRTGNVLVDGQRKIPIERGMLTFDRNECMILVEEASRTMARVRAAE